MLPRISVCIPAYRRARFLPALLDSIARQTSPPYEVVVREDDSDERAGIARIVRGFEARLPLRYIENPHTFGYDANVRACIEAAAGDYCLMMGNDDLLCADAVETVRRVIEAAGEVGVISRAYAVFNGTPENIVQEIRHFPGIRVFDAGREAIVPLYRRTGVLSGLVFHREAARAVATDRWDGSLYYQLFLTANILAERRGAYIGQVLALCREGVAPEFGRSAAEAGFYTPGEYTAKARLKMFGSMMEIIRDLEARTGLRVAGPVLRDLGAYSYYLLAGHPTRPAGPFIRYYRELAKIGVGSHPLYHLYFLSLITIGEGGALKWIGRLRRVWGRTPRLSGVDAGMELKLDSREFSRSTP